MNTHLVTPESSLLNELLSRNLHGSHEPFSPQYNIKETNDEYKLELAVPGYVKEDFQINVEDKSLVIKVANEITREENYLQKEFDRVNFEKKFDLSDKINTEKIEASYENGILSLSLPKKEEARVKPPKLIEIK